MAFGHPVLYAFADFGNIIVAIPDVSKRKQRVYAKFFFSLEQGRTWEEHQLEEPLPADYIVFDSSGLVVVMRFATYGDQLLGHDSHSVQEVFTVIDFSRIFRGKACGIEDFGTWINASGECVNGVKFSVKRRKVNFQCLMRQTFEYLEIEEKICDKCIEKDYECAFEFSRTQQGQCVPDYELLALSECYISLTKLL